MVSPMLRVRPCASMKPIPARWREKGGLGTAPDQGED